MSWSPQGVLALAALEAARRNGELDALASGSEFPDGRCRNRFARPLDRGDRRTNSASAREKFPQYRRPRSSCVPFIAVSASPGLRGHRILGGSRVSRVHKERLITGFSTIRIASCRISILERGIPRGRVSMGTPP